MARCLCTNMLKNMSYVCKFHKLQKLKLTTDLIVNNLEIIINV